MNRLVVGLLVCLWVSEIAAQEFVPDDAWKAKQQASIVALLEGLNADDFKSREKANSDFRKRIVDEEPLRLLAWCDLLVDHLETNPKLRTPEVQARLHDGMAHLVIFAQARVGGAHQATEAIQIVRPQALASALHAGSN